MKLKALNKNVVVEVDRQTERKSMAGLYIVDNTVAAPQTGKVVSAGPDSGVSEGMTVLFSAYTGQEFNDDKVGKKYRIIPADQLYASVE